MNLIHTLLDLFLVTGATWVLWLLIGLSLLSVSLIIERLIFFASLQINLEQLQQQLARWLQARELETARQELAASRGVQAQILLAGLEAHERGPDAMAEAMLSAKTLQRARLERYLAFLGTLGNNAPFIGLFGTVVGIIKAFHDLSLEQSAGAQTVMSGISEALVATAMGLLVALPAVISFNYFQRRIRLLLSSADGMTHLLLSHLRGHPTAK
jgi:biopolymer transport protein ExbB